jgi:hypothetical protein
MNYTDAKAGATVMWKVTSAGRSFTGTIVDKCHIYVTGDNHIWGVRVCVGGDPRGFEVAIPMDHLKLISPLEAIALAAE